MKSVQIIWSISCSVRSEMLLGCCFVTFLLYMQLEPTNINRVGIWWETSAFGTCWCQIYCNMYLLFVPASSVGVATGYILDRPGIEPRWGEIFCSCPDRPWGPPSLLYNGYLVFPRAKVWPGCAADHSPPSSAIMEEYSYTSTHPLGHNRACNENTSLLPATSKITEAPLFRMVVK